MTRHKTALTALLVILALSGTALAATLTIDAPTHLEPNETGEYAVYEDGTNVTASASITSDNGSVLTAHPSNGTLQAAPGNYTAVVEIIASHNGSITDNTTVVIAEPTMSNYDILPLWPTIQAIGTSSTMFIIFIATMLSVAGARAMLKGSSAMRTGGTSPSIILFELVLMAGWVAGMAHSAVVILSMLAGVWAIFMAARNDI